MHVRMYVQVANHSAAHASRLNCDTNEYEVLPSNRLYILPLMIFWKANATQHNDVFHIHICPPNVFVCGYYSTPK